MNIALGIGLVLVCAVIQAAMIAGMLRALHHLSVGAHRVRSYLFDLVVLSSVIITGQSLAYIYARDKKADAE